MNHLAYNEPMWTDSPPYCNTIRIISCEDATRAVRRICLETRGVEYPGTDEEALNDFIAVNYAWYCEAPRTKHSMQPNLVDIPEMELPGMWERADFIDDT